MIKGAYSIDMEKKGKLETPDSSQAEKWLSPDVFVYKGKCYIVALNGAVSTLHNGRNNKK